MVITGHAGRPFQVEEESGDSLALQAIISERMRAGDRELHALHWAVPYTLRVEHVRRAPCAMEVVAPRPPLSAKEESARAKSLSFDPQSFWHLQDEAARHAPQGGRLIGRILSMRWFCAVTD